MARAGGSAGGGVFISYRRSDSALPAALLHEQLAGHFGAEHVFKDVDSISAGDDFTEAIRTAVGSCDTLLLVIGQQWLTVAEPGGGRRLDAEDDLVRAEVEAGLARGVRVVPVLVTGARMPDAAALPPSLRPLARRQAHEIDSNRFRDDTERLIRVLERARAEATRRARAEAARPTPPPPPPPPRTSPDVPGRASRRWRRCRRRPRAARTCRSRCSPSRPPTRPTPASSRGPPSACSTWRSPSSPTCFEDHGGPQRGHRRRRRRRPRPRERPAGRHALPGQVTTRAADRVTLGPSATTSVAGHDREAEESRWHVSS